MQIDSIHVLNITYVSNNTNTVNIEGIQTETFWDPAQKHRTIKDNFARFFLSLLSAVKNFQPEKE